MITGSKAISCCTQYVYRLESEVDKLEISSSATGATNQSHGIPQEWVMFASLLTTLKNSLVSIE